MLKIVEKKKIVVVTICTFVVIAVAVAGFLTNWFGICNDNTENGNDKKQSDKNADEIVNSDSLSEHSGVESDGEDALDDSGSNDNPDEKNDAVSDSSSQNTDASGGKYTGIDTYTNEKGNKAAMTDSGVEVEITADNFKQLMNEYMALSQTDPEKAEELLDQIQIFFDNVETEGFIPVQ